MKSVKLIILAILLFNLPYNIQGLDQTGSPYLDEIVGIEVSPKVYSNGSNLQIKYLADNEVTSLWLVISGSGFDNDSVEMSYISTDGSSKKYSLDLVITTYTTFYAYDNLGMLETFTSNELDINFNRIWSYDERYPELETVTNTTLDGEQYRRTDVGVTIRYSIRTLSQEPIQLLYGPHQDMVAQNMLPMVYHSNSSGYMYYELNITISSREFWFTVNSTNSYEYTSDNSYNLHLVHNGFSVSNLAITSDRNENKTINGRITDHDIPEIYFDITNYTGVETLNPSAHIYFDVDNGSINIPIQIDINRTDIHYKLSLPKIKWGSRVTVDLEFNDSSLDRTIYYSQSLTFTVGKWGPVSYFEHSVLYTNTGDLTVSFVINDIDDVGLKSIELSTLFKNYTVQIGDYTQDISLGKYYGSSYIKLNATNKELESEVVYLPVHYDIVKPEITDLTITPEANRYRITGNTADNSINGTAIKTVKINVGGVVIEVQDIFNTTQVSVDEFITLRPGNNSVSLIVQDMAGNEAIHTIYYIISDTETTTTPFPIWVSIVALVILRRNKDE